MESLECIKKIKRDGHMSHPSAYPAMFANTTKNLTIEKIENGFLFNGSNGRAIVSFEDLAAAVQEYFS